MPSGTSRWRATHFGVINAATLIGKTATSGLDPEQIRGEVGQDPCRSAGSASRPVTNRTCSRALVGRWEAHGPIIRGGHPRIAPPFTRIDLAGEEFASRGRRETSTTAGDVFGRPPALQAESPARPAGPQSVGADSPQAVLIQPGATALTRTFGARLSARLLREGEDGPLGRGEQSRPSPLPSRSRPGPTPSSRLNPTRCAFIRRPTSRVRRMVGTTSTFQRRSSFSPIPELGIRAPSSTSAPAKWTQASSPFQWSQAASSKAVGLIRARRGRRA